MAYNRFLGQNGFRGVDFTSHPSLVHPDRLADALNVWKDYKSGQGSAIETFPGYRQLAKGTGKVYGIFRYRVDGVDYILAHIGTSLCYFKQNDISEGVSLTPICLPPSEEGVDPQEITLADAKSSGFQFGNRFYLIDGTSYIRVSTTKDSKGKISLVAEDVKEGFAYTPTTFINGVEHEQRNMLIDEEYQEYETLSANEYVGGYDFQFRFVEKNKTCFITKVEVLDKPSPTIFIPIYKMFHGEKYIVSRIENNAFQGINSIYTVVLPETVTSIGRYAFEKCNNLTTVYFPAKNTGRVIDMWAFLDCTNLETIYISYGEQDNCLLIKQNAFLRAENVKIVKYEPTGAISEIEWDYENDAAKVTVESTTENPFAAYEIKIPIYSKCKRIKSVFVDGQEIPNAESEIVYYLPNKDGDIITSILICGNISSFFGKTAKITIETDPKHFSSSKYTPFLSAQSGYEGTAQEAILGCTICTQFDGRVFFTGNPALPNTVFYTQRDNTGHNNPFYIGTYNFFDTGIGQTPNSAMIATGSNLIVFKGDTVQDGSINLYQGVDGTDNILPRFYVRQQGLAGVGCLGAACNFADDPVFISKRGLDAVGLQTVNLERSVQHRSTNVDRKLTSEDLAHAQLTEWEGYLVLLVPGGRVYLADSRQLFTNAAGYMEYEWYFLDDIGAYEGDETAFAYSSVFPEGYGEKEGYSLYETPDAPVPERILLEKEGLDPVKSVGADPNNSLYYLEQEGKKYLVYKTGEKIGGTFYPASCIVGIDDYLIFGTENGAICVFNTDKRGTMAANDKGIDTRDIIPREYFSHMGHRYLSTIILALENAGVPNMAKNTVKRTVVLKAKDIFGSVFKWNVRTDRKVFGTNPDVAMAKGEISNAVTDLDFLEFQYINFDTSYDGALIVLNEKKKRYVEKQYAFFSDGYCRPFGIYHIAYQYEIQGKVKNR